LLLANAGRCGKADLRDENGILILPLISLKRVNIDRTPGNSALVREVPYVTVKKNIHAKTANIQNLVEDRLRSNFPQKKIIPVEEYLTIPFPDFCTIFYEITIWTQFQTQINEILEKIFYNYDYNDSFAMFTDYKNGVGSGYRFVGYRDGNVTPQTNIEEFSAEERIIKYVYNIKVPVYLMLDPKDETLAYGRNKTESTKDKNTKIIHKSQNVVAIRLKESVIGAGVVDQLKAADIDLFNNEQDAARQALFNLLNSGGSSGGGGGGGGSTLTFDTADPQPIYIVPTVGSSGKVSNSDHVHFHGFLPGGGLHSVVSSLSAGFAPVINGSNGYVLTQTGTSASWSASGGGEVTGSTNFFVTNLLKVSGSIANPVGHLILSSSVGSKIVISSSLVTFGNLVINGSNSFSQIDGASTTWGIAPSEDSAATIAFKYTGGSLVTGRDAEVYFASTNVPFSNSALISSKQDVGSGISFATRGSDGHHIRHSITGLGHIFPQSDNAYDIGTSGSRVRTLYLGTALEFSGAENPHHIKATNSHLILSSSAGSKITVSGSLLVTDPASIITRGVVYNDTGHLILSGSSAGGSVVTISGTTLNFTGDALLNGGHVVAKSSHLVLSSSAGTVMASSGGLVSVSISGGLMLSSRIYANSKW